MFAFNFVSIALVISLVLMVTLTLIDQNLLGNQVTSNSHKLMIAIASIGHGLITGVLFALVRHDPPPPPPRRIIIRQLSPRQTSEGRTIH